MDGTTPLHRICLNDQVGLAQLMIENGVDLNVQQDSDEATAMHVACENRFWRVAKLLIENGADVHVHNSKGQTPLHYTSSWWDDVETDDFYDGLSDDEETEETNKDHLEVAKLLIQNGADVQAKDNDGKTSLYLACENGHLDVVQLLLGQGANLNIMTAKGATPLDAASEGNHLEVVWFLVRQHPRLVSEQLEQNSDTTS